MTEKALNKRYRSRLRMHQLFGFGGAIVILGALFKILHLEIGPITGGLVLGIGLGMEALIFTFTALNTGEIKEEHEEFIKKMKGEVHVNGAAYNNEQGLSSKIDALMAEAKLDVDLMHSLTTSIKELENSAKALEPASQAIKASENYSKELNTAASQLEELNTSYQKQIIANQNAEQLKQQMEDLTAKLVSLSSNLAALNTVYSGVLDAMTKK